MVRQMRHSRQKNYLFGKKTSYLKVITQCNGNYEPLFIEISFFTFNKTFFSDNIIKFFIKHNPKKITLK